MAGRFRSCNRPTAFHSVIPIIKWMTPMPVEVSFYRSRIALLCLAAALTIPVATIRVTAQGRAPRPAPTPGPMLSDGTIGVDAPGFQLKLVKSSQTVAAMEPKEAPGFDFTPAELLVERSQNGYYHLGDIDLRVRKGNGGAWSDYSTALARTPVRPLPLSASVLAAADLGPTLPADIPLKVTRQWVAEGGTLALRFELTNQTKESVEVGALGIPMVFDNVLTGKSLDKAHQVCSFYDPYIGEDAGYLQVTRLNGHGRGLLVVPDGKTPFEAYNPILQTPRGAGAGAGQPKIFTDPTPRSTTFEGFFDW